MTELPPPQTADVDFAAPDPAADASARQAGPRSRDKLMMLAATAARMAIGLLTFIVLARYLGPTAFGVIATAIAYCTFFGIVTDFGLTTYTLRTAAMTPDRAGRIVRDTLAAKSVLSLIAAVAGMSVLVAVLPQERIAVYVLAFVGTTASSAADLALIVVRARRRFAVEAKLVVSTSVLLMLGVAGVTALTRDVTAAAAAFAVTRLLYLAIIVAALRGELAAAPPEVRLLRRVGRTLVRARAFAVDSILTSLSGQIDVLLFGALLVAHDMGIYQAGARLVQVIMPFAVVLSTVYMPALSAAVGHGDDAAFRRHAGRLNIEFTVLAIAGGLGFALAGPLVTSVLYGNRYDALMPLWGGFGAFAVLRFSSAAYGIQLAALGHIRTRIAAQVLTIAVFAGMAAWLLPLGGLRWTSWLLALSGLPVLFVLGGGLLRDGRSGKSLKWSIAVSLAATLGLWWV